MLTLEQLNAASQAEFTALLDGPTNTRRGSPRRAWAKRPSPAWLRWKLALVEALREARTEAQLADPRPPRAGRQGRWSARR